MSRKYDFPAVDHQLLDPIVLHELNDATVDDLRDMMKRVIDHSESSGSLICSLLSLSAVLIEYTIEPAMQTKITIREI